MSQPAQQPRAAALDEALLAGLPAVTPAEAAECLRREFGVEGELTRLSGERDLNFRVDAAAGSRFVLKIAGDGEEEDALAFQNAALIHVAAADPALPVPRLVASRSGATMVRAGIGGSTHLVRLLTYLPGVPALSLPASSAVRREAGLLLARLDRALSDFDHRGADQHFIWDLQHAAALRAKIAFLRDEGQRALATRTLDGFDAHVAPRLASLRRQVIHNDLNQNNLLRDRASGRITGVIDFGDMVRSCLVNEVAIGAAHQLYGETDVLGAIADVVAGFAEALPLTGLEAELLPDLVKTRLVTRELIVAWRGAANPAATTSYSADVSRLGWAALARLDGIDLTTARSAMAKAASTEAAGARGKEAQVNYDSLMQRRAKVLGPIYKQFYQAPFFPVKGEGVWITDHEGKRYLDAYNNVPHVGHCHPHVAEAAARQLHVFNSNTRYPSDLIVDYAERIVATLPEPLKICMFACTGTEANELAWRIAMANSGGTGAIVTSHAFHGNSTIIGALDTSTIPTQRLKPWVATVPAPQFAGLRKDRAAPGAAAYAAHYPRAVEDLAVRGHRPAALIACPVFASDGLYSAPAGFLEQAMAPVRKAGALIIADEVQSALGRTGTHFWGFEHAGFVPDIVTMAKPMGNGLPLSLVVTRRELVEGFLKEERYFNTFAGNQVVAAAGLAVLDVIEREGLQRNALEVGAYLRGRLGALMEASPCIGDVRGTGLFVGVEIVKDRATDAPDPARARAIIEAMMQRGVLVGLTGSGRNLLKIRPPMSFSRQNADLVADTLREVLAAA
jgi:4-aminobutyrate aminotransferase-like enzyme/Ser/Thr protein kinase RdoA (MazF antagonist)